MAQNPANKFELSRRIPENIARQVRQRCGFGCVCCGMGIYQYHHADPPFEDAKFHDPNGIVCLCGACHDKVTRDIWSNDKILSANQDPFCKKAGFSRDEFDLDNPTVVLGSVTITGTPELIRIGHEPLLQIQGHEEPGSPFRLSGKFYDDEETMLFEIEQNEWRGFMSNWDISVEGRKLIIRKAARKIALEIRVDPPNTIFIDRLDMVCRGVKIYGDASKGDFQVTGPGGGVISLRNSVISGCGCGILVPDDALSGQQHFGRGGRIDISAGLVSGCGNGFVVE